MLFRWLRQRRRRQLLQSPFPPAWEVILRQDVHYYTRLSIAQQARLRDITRILIAEKEWEGIHGFEVTDRARVVIAACAALLLLEIDHDHYPQVPSILIHPNVFEDDMDEQDGLIQTEDVQLSGQAVYRGPVVLSWLDCEAGARGEDAGGNVILHEFAHRLDMLDGLVDGTPPINDPLLLKRWVAVMTREYEQLVDDARRRRPTLLDDYGAQDPGEFFAVCTEAFFERPRDLKLRHSELYGVLRGYYRQDPASWPTD